MSGSRLISRTVVPYLDAAPDSDVQRGLIPPRGHVGELVALRHEALDVLATGYRSVGRIAWGLLAWLAVTGGATGGVVALGSRETWSGVTVALVVIGAVVVAGLGAWLGWSVLRAGRSITLSAARWLRVPAPTAAGRDAVRLKQIVLRRVGLGGALAVAAVLLGAALVLALTQRLTAVTGGTGVAALALGGGAVTGTAAILAVAAVATAGAGAAVLTGAGRLLDAAWQRPTVAPAREPAPAVEYWAPHAWRAAREQAVQHAGTPAGSGPAAPSGHAPVPAVPASPAPAGTLTGAVDPAPPTVEIDLSGIAAALKDQASAGQADQAPPSTVPADEPPNDVLPLEVVLPDGRVLQPGTTLLGRRPEARAQDDPVDAHAVLTDRTVSKTHTSITVTAEGLWVVDRASTNGTLLEDAAGTLTRCRPWRRTAVLTPVTIHVGHARLRVRSVAVPAAPARGTYEVAS